MRIRHSQNNQPPISKIDERSQGASNEIPRKYEMRRASPLAGLGRKLLQERRVDIQLAGNCTWRNLQFWESRRRLLWVRSRFGLRYCQVVGVLGSRLGRLSVINLEWCFLCAYRIRVNSSEGGVVRWWDVLSLEDLRHDDCNSVD